MCASERACASQLVWRRLSLPTSSSPPWAALTSTRAHKNVGHWRRQAGGSRRRRRRALIRAAALDVHSRAPPSPLAASAAARCSTRAADGRLQARARVPITGSFAADALDFVQRGFSTSRLLSLALSCSHARNRLLPRFLSASESCGDVSWSWIV